MARGGYTPQEIRQMSDEEILFIYHYQLKAEHERVDLIGRMLGTTWDLEEILANRKSSDGAVNNKLLIPLTVAVNPKIMEYVHKQADNVNIQQAYIGGGEYQVKKGEKIKSMGELSKDEFLKMIGKK